MKIFRCDDPIDIAVLIPPEQLTITFPLEPTAKGMQYGQDMYFIGFPFGMKSAITGAAYPFGFVKKVVLSGMQYTGSSHVAFLDGYNVFGFSGSPVVFRVGNDFTHNVMSVVSGFEANLGPVLIPKEIKRSDIKPKDREAGLVIEKNGKTFLLDETASGMTVKLNTGIVRCYGIEHAVDLTRQHAIGPLTSEAFVALPLPTKSGSYEQRAAARHQGGKRISTVTPSSSVTSLLSIFSHYHRMQLPLPRLGSLTFECRRIQTGLCLSNVPTKTKSFRSNILRLSSLEARF